MAIAKYANGLFYSAVMRAYGRKFSVTPSTPLLSLSYNEYEWLQPHLRAIVTENPDCIFQRKRIVLS